MRARSGGQLLPRTKAHLIWSPRPFFNDLQEWEWIERRFDPRRAFALPRSIKALIGPDPRVIADEVWAKLMWAGLNLTAEDLPLHANRGGTGTPWYPLELVRAIAMLWLFAGLRDDEILRLRVGAIRWQQQTDRDGERAGVSARRADEQDRDRVHQAGRPASSATRSSAGRHVRPAQPEVHGPQDRRAGRHAALLTAARGSARSTSTGCWSRCCAARPACRARTSAARSPAIAPGRRSPPSSTTPRTRCRCSSCRRGSGTHRRSSTQHYARITPVTLTKAYTDAGYFARNVRTIEVLLDRDAITNGHAGNGGPFEFYDLGHGYCSYSFFEQCPHRMACARCDFYLPKPSSEAQLLEAKDGLQRMLVQIPLTDDERAAVEGDQTAVDRLHRPAGRHANTGRPTPRQIPHRTAPVDAGTRRRVDSILSAPLHRAPQRPDPATVNRHPTLTSTRATPPTHPTNN